MKLLISSVALATLLMCVPAFAQSERARIGGDEFVAGNYSSISSPVAHDAFAVGFNVDISGPVSANAHGAGFSVTVTGDIANDLYAFGNTVSITGAVGDSVTASGASVSITGDGSIGGNLRAAGANLVVAKPVLGSAVLAGATVILSNQISGDLMFTGDEIIFEEGARIDGQVTIKTSSDVTVPASVASADRVTIEKIDLNTAAPWGAGEIAQQSVKGFWPPWLPILTMLAVLLVGGAIWLALFPRRSLIVYRTAISKPWKSLAYGIFTLAGFVGLIPVLAVTVIGLPVVPIAIVLLIVAGIMGHISGAWILALRVMSGFGFEATSTARRLLVLAIGVVAAWLLGLIPFVGWLILLALTFAGLGAMALSALGQWIDQDFHKRLASEVQASEPA